MNRNTDSKSTTTDGTTTGRNGYGRRPLLKAIGAGLVFGTTAVSVSAGSDELTTQRFAVRTATVKYRDADEARADGYGTISPYVPNMGFHFGRDPHYGTDIADPPILVYFANEDYDPDPFQSHVAEHDDDLVLGGVEYAVDSEEDDDVSPDIFADEESHRNLKVSEEEGWHWTPPLLGHALHAWVHRGNPEGVFHPTNPEID